MIDMIYRNATQTPYVYDFDQKDVLAWAKVFDKYGDFNEQAILIDDISLDDVMNTITGPWERSRFVEYFIKEKIEFSDFTTKAKVLGICKRALKYGWWPDRKTQIDCYYDIYKHELKTNLFEFVSNFRISFERKDGRKYLYNEWCEPKHFNIIKNVTVALLCAVANNTDKDFVNQMSRWWQNAHVPEG
jgi:hypothetical protein